MPKKQQRAMSVMGWLLSTSSQKSNHGVMPVCLLLRVCVQLRFGEAEAQACSPQLKNASLAEASTTILLAKR